MVYITRGVGREPLVLPPFVGAVSGPRLSLEIDQLILRGGDREREKGEQLALMMDIEKFTFL